MPPLVLARGRRGVAVTCRIRHTPDAREVDCRLRCKVGIVCRIAWATTDRNMKTFRRHRRHSSAIRSATVLAAASAVLSAASAQAAAGGLVSEMRFGVLAHDVPLWASAAREDRCCDINLEILFAPSIALLGGRISPALGGNLNVNGDTSSIYLDARWQLETASGLFFGLGLGVAVHDGERHLVSLDRKALGSSVLFHIPFEIGMRLDAHNFVSIYYEHMSNGELAAENEGLDRLGVRYGYRF